MDSQRQQILERGSYFPGDWVRPRYNPGTWMALVDAMEIFTGHRSITSAGSYELYDGPIGVELRVEEAQKSEPFLTSEKEWEADRYMDPSPIGSSRARSSRETFFIVSTLDICKIFSVKSFSSLSAGSNPCSNR